MPTITSLQLALDPVVLAALADDNGDGLPDGDVIDGALAASDAWVRQRVGASLELPANAPLPALLDDIALTLAVERLFERRRDVPPGVWLQRAQRARLLLDNLAAGVVPLADVASRSAPVAATRSPEDRRQPADILNLY